MSRQRVSRRKRDCRPIYFRALVAAHEAGHAISAVLLGRQLHRVTIVRGKASSGRCVADDPIDTPEQMKSSIVYSFAGPAAEALLSGSYDHNAAESDYKEAGKLIKKLKLTIDQYDEIYLSMRKLITDYRTEIEIVAGALLDEKTLLVTEVMELIRR